MKKNIFLVAITVIFAACSNNKPVEQASTAKEISMTDTAGLAEYQQLKEQQQYEMNAVSEEAKSYNATPLTDKASNRPVVIYRTVPSRELKAAKISKPARSTQRSVVRKSEDRYGNESSGTESGTETTETGVGTQPTASTGTGVGEGPVATTTPAETPIPEKKKGWSKAAKGTAIGAGSGAVLGAIIGKNKAKGAVIGGIIGAAGGYVLGRGQDKKDGRY